MKNISKPNLKLKKKLLIFQANPTCCGRSIAYQGVAPIFFFIYEAIEYFFFVEKNKYKKLSIVVCRRDKVSEDSPHKTG